MYIMVKTYQNLELFGPDWQQVLSILESRKNNQAGTSALSGGLQSRSTPKRMASAAKLVQYQRGIRKSSSLTNGMNRPETKVSLESMAKKARGLLSKLLPPSMRPSWTSADALSIAPRRRH